MAPPLGSTRNALLHCSCHNFKPTQPLQFANRFLSGLFYNFSFQDFDRACVQSVGPCNSRGVQDFPFLVGSMHFSSNNDTQPTQPFGRGGGGRRQVETRLPTHHYSHLLGMSVVIGKSKVTRQHTNTTIFLDVTMEIDPPEPTRTPVRTVDTVDLPG